MRKTKKILFTILMLIIIFLIISLIGEIFSRIFISKRLIAKVEENGLYHFKPNQEGWYTHLLKIPFAKINNIGARGEDIKINKTKKYIFLGDSFVFGWLLNDKETIPYYFMQEKRLDHNKVINYGCGGYGIGHMINIYNFYNYIFNKEDTIIMIMIEDNFYRSIIPYKKSLTKEIFWKIKEKSSFISWTWANFRYASNSFKSEKIRQYENTIKKNEKKLLDFNNLIQKNNQNLIYVFYEYNQTNYSINAKNFCEENNLSCITNIYEYIDIVKRNKKEIFTIDNTHPSPESNKAVAKGIINFINNIN